MKHVKNNEKSGPLDHSAASTGSVDAAFGLFTEQVSMIRDTQYLNSAKY